MKKINFRALIALVILVAVIYFAMNAVRTRSYDGPALSFSAGNGNVVRVVNHTDEPAAVILTASRAYRIASGNGEINITPTREGQGRSAVYRWEGEIPSGVFDLRVTRGSDVQFDLTAADGITARVKPYSDTATRNILIVTGVFSLGVLYYISRTTEHAWMRRVRQSGPFAKLGKVRPSAA